MLWGAGSREVGELVKNDGPSDRIALRLSGHGTAYAPARSCRDLSAASVRSFPARGTSAAMLSSLRAVTASRHHCSRMAIAWSPILTRWG